MIEISRNFCGRSTGWKYNPNLIFWLKKLENSTYMTLYSKLETLRLVPKDPQIIKQILLNYSMKMAITSKFHPSSNQRNDITWPKLFINIIITTLLPQISIFSHLYSHITSLTYKEQQSMCNWRNENECEREIIQHKKNINVDCQYPYICLLLHKNK